MDQLSLFHGMHVPRTAARAALRAGDLDRAHVRLLGVAAPGPEANEAARLGHLIEGLARAGDDPSAIHGAFAAVLRDADGAPGFLGAHEWFALYASRQATALANPPARSHRGWLAPHFAYAAGDRDRARELTDALMKGVEPGPEWLEGARLAYVLGDTTTATHRLQRACLESTVPLDPAPPVLEGSGFAQLDAQRDAIPRLPPSIEELFEQVPNEGVPDPSSPSWIAVIGEMDGLLPMPLDAEVQSAQDSPAGRFLDALRAARRARSRDGHRSPERCSDRELRARRRMLQIAPALFDRYLEQLRR